jgi:hypothetical protein
MLHDNKLATGGEGRGGDGRRTVPKMDSFTNSAMTSSM